MNLWYKYKRIQTQMYVYIIFCNIKKHCWVNLIRCELLPNNNKAKNIDIYMHRLILILIYLMGINNVCINYMTIVISMVFIYNRRLIDNLDQNVCVEVRILIYVSLVLIRAHAQFYKYNWVKLLNISFLLKSNN